MSLVIVVHTIVCILGANSSTQSRPSIINDLETIANPAGAEIRTCYYSRNDGSRLGKHLYEVLAGHVTRFLRGSAQGMLEVVELAPQLLPIEFTGHLFPRSGPIAALFALTTSHVGPARANQTVGSSVSMWRIRRQLSSIAQCPVHRGVDSGACPAELPETNGPRLGPGPPRGPERT
jgi:hypothetical protein